LYLDVVTLSSTVVLVFSQVLFCCLFCELSDLTSPGIHPETRIFILFFGMKVSVDVNIFVIFFQRAMDSIVPNCPAGLCITKQDFLKPDFSVDIFFIEQSVRDSPLDTLRYDGLPRPASLW